MKVYNKVVWQWVGDDLVRVEEESFDYEGPVAEAKGGGGGNQYYENLNKLYGIQADQAQFLGNLYKDTVAPAYGNWMQQAAGYDSFANQEDQAIRAAADSSSALTSSRLALHDNLASMGINPADERYQRMMANQDTAGAASMAQNMSNARNQVRQQGFARMQDVIGMGMGTPTQASSAAQGAANAANAGMQGQIAQQQANANNVGNAIRGGVGIWNMATGNNNNQGFADGGEVLQLNGGGYVQRMARGGIMGGMGGANSAGGITPPVSNASPQSYPGMGAQNVGQGLGMQGTGSLGRGVSKLGSMMNSPGMSNFGAGMQAGSAAPLDTIRNLATNQVDATLGTANQAASSLEGANANLAAAQSAQSAAEAAGAAGGQEAAATAAAQAAAEQAALEAGAAGAAQAGAEAATVGAGIGAGGAAGAGALLGAAVPIVGAGLATYGIGNALGWWADGGTVTPGSNGAYGGKVRGPGGPKDDKIHAMLSDGEFVMPVGAVKFFGLDRLEKMRQKGLEYEKQLGIGRGHR